jgi:predicted helicase
MACGTGKTLTALFIAERLAAQRTLVLVPSLSLLAQTMQEWTANSSSDFDFLPVCSDETVSEIDAPIGRTSDLGFPVTTHPDATAGFLAQETRQVVFSTYQSSTRVAEAQQRRGTPEFDLVVADEAHRCAGRVGGEFATVLDGASIRSRRRLFMTATPRYYTGRVLREAREADLEVASMDDEQVFGPVLPGSGMSTSNAHLNAACSEAGRACG